LRNLSTFRSGKRGWRSLLPALAAVFATVCVPVSGATRGELKPVSQYLHEEWGSEKGFPGGSATVIAQTPDGYLWIGTGKGLVRFDGRNFQFFSEGMKNGGPMGGVLDLLVDGEGSLWVRLHGARLLRYRDGKFEEFTNNFEGPEIAVTRMCRGPDGRAVFATILNGIVAYDHDGFVTLAPHSQLPNFLVLSMAPRSDGGYWLGTRDTGLFVVSNGSASPARAIRIDQQINALLADGPKNLWIGTDQGLLLWDGGKLTQIGVNSSLRGRQILALTQDGQGSVWVGTDQGTYRLDAESKFSPKPEDFAANGPVEGIFFDREGNIWTANHQGIQRFRNTIFTTYSTSEGLPAESNGPVYAAPDGRTWFAPSTGGLYVLKDRRVERVALAGLDKDVVYSIAGREGDIWVGRQLGGLTRLRDVAGKWDAVTYTKANGLAQNSVYSVHVDPEGAVWAGTVSAGVTKIKNDKFSTFTNENGLLSNTIASIVDGSDGTIWLATPRGLSGLSNDRWSSYSKQDGLPSDDVNCLFEDSARTLWIGTASGLAALRSGKVWVPPQISQVLSEPIYGVQVDANGFLWIATSNHVAMVDRERLLQPDFNAADIREFGFADGLRNTDGVKREGTVVADSSGQMWFSLKEGLAVVDVNRARVVSPPPILHVEGLSADSAPLSLSSSVRIPPDSHRITIDYSGLSLSVPEGIRFKYELDGFDRNWSEPVTAREATYTNLNPGAYVFRVIASNSEGLWNSGEATISFRVVPVFWRTWWFRGVALLGVTLFVLALFRLRVLALTHQMNMRFEERLEERARIARELHDTLLQGFTGLLLRFESVAKRFPEHDPTRELLDQVLERGDRILIEGRETVQKLRAENAQADDLQAVFAGMVSDLKLSSSAQFRLTTEGSPRSLHPVIQDEVCRIGREALANAFLHSHASGIETEVVYNSRWLVLRIRDNGCGIDPEILKAGRRQGHWGLVGMRERAERAGGQFHVWSGEDAGTEIELKIPGKIAFQDNSSRSRWRSIVGAFAAQGKGREKSRDR
jgi:ligand-binding sensor domain-containing protein/signal transduction histidine kinase